MRYSDINNIEYMKRSKVDDVQMVPFNEREAVKNYFTGQTSAVNPDLIDERVRSTTLMKKSFLKAGKVAQTSK